MEHITSNAQKGKYTTPIVIGPVQLQEIYETMKVVLNNTSSIRLVKYRALNKPDTANQLGFYFVRTLKQAKTWLNSLHQQIH